MGWWDRLRTRPPRADDADLTKAVSTPTAGQGGVMSTADAATFLRVGIEASRTAQQPVRPAAPLPRDPRDLTGFGPGVPIFPAALDPGRPDTGRPEPRIYEYPVSANLPGVTDRLIPWKVLRDAADAIGLFRRCIEVRKAHVIGLDWDVTISRDAINLALYTDPTATRVDVERQLRTRLESEIGRLRAFWAEPDRGNGHTFPDWVAQLLEEHFVLDAVAIYPRRTYAGDVWSLELLDGSTIKPLLDARGGRPLPPHPAYQQILHGFPRGEFIANTLTDAGVTLIPNAYPADQLIYFRRNVRTNTPYGKSSVEQALYDGEVWLRRLQWIKSEYTEGALPPARFKNMGGDPEFWSPAQLGVYEQALNDMYAGDTAARRKVKLLPPGWETDGGPHEVADRYKPDYDLFLIKLVTSHFETVAQELGFSETSGLGSAGFHEGQEDVQDRKATHPTLTWLQARLTDVSRRVLGMPAELEFRFLGLDSEDEAAADAVWEARVKTGRATVNEDRDRSGLPRYTIPEADTPLVMTNRGVVPLEGAIEQAANDAKAAAAATRAGDTQTGAEGAAGTAAKPQQQVSKADELTALRRYLAKGERPRPFETTVLTKADVETAGLDAARVVFKADGGGAGGREPDPRVAGVRPLPDRGDDRRVVVYQPGV